jgi:hypothetical protein
MPHHATPSLTRRFHYRLPCVHARMSAGADVVEVATKQRRRGGWLPRCTPPQPAYTLICFWSPHMFILLILRLIISSIVEISLLSLYFNYKYNLWMRGLFPLLMRRVCASGPLRAHSTAHLQSSLKVSGAILCCHCENKSLPLSLPIHHVLYHLPQRDHTIKPLP